MDNIEKINEELEDTIKNIKYDYIIGEIMETKISVSDIVAGARAYFSEPDGKKKYEEYITYNQNQ